MLARESGKVIGMQLGFFTMPIHPSDKDWPVSLREDRATFVLADELGFTEACCGEHSAGTAENTTSSAMFLATLVDQVRQMRLGTGTVNLPNAGHDWRDPTLARRSTTLMAEKVLPLVNAACA